ncbi:hypothetical protein AURDEDRAFT_133876 [Auricularia subglabra TFB-10046 SS5]|nr:hypothetical protein AURDEDRAFT_133876 [Auricularia subglabra TFB-10046 SS5]
MSFARAVSPASSLSEFSVISHPLSPSNSAILVEPGSDDDEIVFSPRALAHAESGRRPSQASGIDSDDDFILIASPRAQRAPSLQASMAGLALSLHPAPSRNQPTDEPPVTPTQATSAPLAAAPGLPTPSSSDASHRSVARASQPSSPTQPAPAAKPVQRRKHKAKRPVIAPATTGSAASYPSPSPSPVQVATPTVPSTIISAPCIRDQRRSAASGAMHDNEQQQPSARPASRSQRKQPKFEQTAKLQVLAESCEGIGSRGVVVEDDDEMTLYQAAVNYISSFLAHPEEGSGLRLPLLQALVVELGICKPSSQLPASVRAAKALLKAHAHINVRDYIASRGKGVEALQKVMFANRTQLLKDLRKRRVPLKWIKDHGLSMFLVSLF